MIRRYHDTLQSACNAIKHVRGGTAYRRGAVSAQHTAEVARWDMHQQLVVAGEVATSEERQVCTDSNFSPIA